MTGPGWGAVGLMTALIVAGARALSLPPALHDTPLPVIEGGHAVRDRSRHGGGLAHRRWRKRRTAGRAQ